MILNTNKRARKQANASRPPNPSPTKKPEARRVRLCKELLSTSDAQQLDITARDAVRLQHKLPATADETGPDLLKFETRRSKGDPEAVRTLKRATIGAHYLPPVKRAIFQPDRYPPLFERLRADLRKKGREDSPYITSLTPNVKVNKQQAGWYAESLFRSKDFMKDPVTLFLMGKEVLQKARIIVFVESNMISSSNMNCTLMDVRVMNMP